MSKYFTRKFGSKEIKVKPNTIIANQSVIRRHSQDILQINQKNINHKEEWTTFGTQNCKYSEIRKGYYKKKLYKKHYFKRSKSPVCITSSGKASKIDIKQKQLFVLKKGLLSKYGYFNVNYMSENERHKALKLALIDIQPLSLFRELNALYVFNENKDPHLANLFKQDRNWIKTTKEYSNRPTSKKSKNKSNSRIKYNYYLYK